MKPLRPLPPPLLVALLVLLAALPAPPGARADPARGELLYETHCVACHDRQVHWRDRKIVGDWNGLTAEVRRWSANIGVRWPDDTVEDVARYLNRRYYNFPEQPRKGTG